jgi:hypothetical protein
MNAGGCALLFPHLLSDHHIKNLNSLLHNTHTMRLSKKHNANSTGLHRRMLSGRLYLNLKCTLTLDASWCRGDQHSTLHAAAAGNGGHYDTALHRVLVLVPSGGSSGCQKHRQQHDIIPVNEMIDALLHGPFISFDATAGRVSNCGSRHF